MDKTQKAVEVFNNYANLYEERFMNFDLFVFTNDHMRNKFQSFLDNRRVAGRVRNLNHITIVLAIDAKTR